QDYITEYIIRSGGGEVLPNVTNTPDQNSSMFGTFLKWSGYFTGTIGTYYSVRGDLFYNSLYWIQKNGRLRFTSSIGNNYLFQRSHSLVATATSTARSVSKVMGITGVAISLAQVAIEPTTGNAFDAAMGATTFIPGVGWAISGTYFISN